MSRQTYVDSFRPQLESVLAQGCIRWCLSLYNWVIILLLLLFQDFLTTLLSICGFKIWPKIRFRFKIVSLAKKSDNCSICLVSICGMRQAIRKINSPHLESGLSPCRTAPHRTTHGAHRREKREKKLYKQYKRLSTAHWWLQWMPKAHY